MWIAVLLACYTESLPDHDVTIDCYGSSRIHDASSFAASSEPKQPPRIFFLLLSSGSQLLPSLQPRLLLDMFVDIIFYATLSRKT